MSLDFEESPPALTNELKLEQNDLDEIIRKIYILFQ